MLITGNSLFINVPAFSYTSSRPLRSLEIIYYHIFLLLYIALNTETYSSERYEVQSTHPVAVLSGSAGLLSVWEYLVSDFLAGT